MIGFVGLIWTMGEAGEVGYEFEDENINVGKDRLRVLWEGPKLNTPISDVIVIWLKKSL